MFLIVTKSILVCSCKGSLLKMAFQAFRCTGSIRKRLRHRSACISAHSDQRLCYHSDPKNSDQQDRANSVDPDQSFRSGCALFCHFVCIFWAHTVMVLSFRMDRSG